MKKNIYLYEKNEFYKIDKIIRERNSSSFFNKVNRIKDNNKNIISVSFETLISHYDNIFNEKINVEESIIHEINSGISDLSILNFKNIDLNESELVSALNDTNNSNVCGNDGISNYMILNTNLEFKKSIIFYFFKYIFKYGYIPNNFNVSHIIPIIKDKNKSSSDVNNLRPISISNALAQIFERLILIKIPNIIITSEFQFGYKRKISCSHALFAFKETIIKYLEDKLTIYAAKLDAVKAFDKLWREGLFYKMKKKKIFDINVIILLKIYYDLLAGYIKLDNKLSMRLKLKRGVKQGGVISGILFNFFLDELLELCSQSGFGATFFEIIQCIFGFCDDLCLLSQIIEELQKLLLICEKYAKDWAIEFNISKCQIMMFGSKKQVKENSAQFFLNGKEIEYTDNFKYLGLEFTHNLDMSNFFIKKFQGVSKSFYSLNSFGFKCGGVDPFLQAFIYKSFCLSRMLYGIEIMTLNKKTIQMLNINQNNIIRYFTGLSRNSHISNVTKILKLFNMKDLYFYMKLVFIKNLKNNSICTRIFDYLLISNYRSNTISFIKDFDLICDTLELDEDFIIKNINQVLLTYKENSREICEYDSCEAEIIKTCLNNNHDFNFIKQLNLATYAGPLFDKNKL